MEVQVGKDMKDNPEYLGYSQVTETVKIYYDIFGTAVKDKKYGTKWIMGTTEVEQAGQ